MALKGRGSGYSLARGVGEALLGRAFATGWPARANVLRSRVERVDHLLPVAGLADGRALRVGFASDLHAGPTTPQRTLDEAFEHLRAFRPDLLLLGGDYVLFEARHAETLVPRIQSVAAPLGRFAVLGNHDLWADDRAIVSSLGRAGVEVLVNERRTVAPGVSIGGLDDAWTGRPDYERAFEGQAPVHLLLMHSPDHVPHLGRARFSLALCGHTHGGQVATPGGAPIALTSAQSRRFPFGRFDLPGGPLLVSRGVGNVEVPFRAFAPPDVLCITLRGGALRSEG